jgi:hypothetical protein
MRPKVNLEGVCSEIDRIRAGTLPPTSAVNAGRLLLLHSGRTDEVDAITQFLTASDEYSEGLDNMDFEPPFPNKPWLYLGFKK